MNNIWHVLISIITLKVLHQTDSFKTVWDCTVQKAGRTYPTGRESEKWHIKDKKENFTSEEN
jgi:hypothetical protein